MLANSGTHIEETSMQLISGAASQMSAVDSMY